jgi:hypothetical protein
VKEGWPAASDQCKSRLTVPLPDLFFKESRHGWAIDRLGRSQKVSALSNDGVAGTLVVVELSN